MEGVWTSQCDGTSACREVLLSLETQKIDTFLPIYQRATTIIHFPSERTKPDLVLICFDVFRNLRVKFAYY
jgi:hypothetical protein